MDEEEPELHALASHFGRQGGALWIAGGGTGMVATRPLPGGAWEICRVYVHPDHHGGGLAHRLMDLAEGHATGAALELWSDTRFLRAHRFYEKRGYVRGDRRALNDRSNSHEYRFNRPGIPSRPLPSGKS